MRGRRRLPYVRLGSMHLRTLLLLAVLAAAAAPARLSVGAGPCVPLHRLRALRRPGGQRGHRRPAGAGHEVPVLRGRLHHRAALLQAAQQHGPARRPPVDGRRHEARGDRVPDETASGWQDGRACRRRRRSPPARPTSSPTTRATGHFAFSPGYFSSPAGLRPADRARRGGNGVYRYGASGFPDATWNATNYWVDATFERTPPGDTRAPRVDVGDARPTAPTDVPGRHDGHRHVRRGDRPRLRHGPGLQLRDGSGTAVAGVGRLRRRDAQGDAHAVRPARLRPDLHGDGQERRRAASRTPPATPWPPTARGPSARPRACPCTVFAPGDGPARRRASWTRRSRSA